MFGFRREKIRWREQDSNPKRPTSHHHPPSGYAKCAIHLPNAWAGYSLPPLSQKSCMIISGCDDRLLRNRRFDELFSHSMRLAELTHFCKAHAKDDAPRLLSNSQNPRAGLQCGYRSYPSWSLKLEENQPKQGSPLGLVSQTLGHASVVVTNDFYGIFAVDELQSAVNHYYKSPDSLKKQAF